MLGDIVVSVLMMAIASQAVIASRSAVCRTDFREQQCVIDRMKRDKQKGGA